MAAPVRTCPSPDKDNRKATRLKQAGDGTRCSPFLLNAAKERATAALTKVARASGAED
jgi:hypothetical protein